jgi:hypothetical protein
LARLPHPPVWHPNETIGAQVIEDFLWVLEQLTRGSEEQIDAVLDWLADIVQNPAAKRLSQSSRWPIRASASRYSSMAF